MVALHPIESKGCPSIRRLLAPQQPIYACMHACMHTCIHAYMHTCIHACMHAYMHTCIHAYMHTCIHAYMHTCIHAYMHTCVHTYIHTYIHTYVCMCICVCVYIYICTFRTPLPCGKLAPGPGPPRPHLVPGSKVDPQNPPLGLKSSVGHLRPPPPLPLEPPWPLLERLCPSFAKLCNNLYQPHWPASAHLHLTLALEDFMSSLPNCLPPPPPGCLAWLQTVSACEARGCV